jgi:catechol 2,3-dioxygenase-like lactoylglutathione lyase family enzyme
MIHHGTHPVSPSSLDDCVRFYAILRFHRVPEPPGIAGRAVWLERHCTQIKLMVEAGAGSVEAGSTAEAAGARSVEAGSTAVSGHVALVVDEYEATLETLRASGHEVQSRPEHWGSPRAYVQDPAGHRVELMAWAPRGG